MKLWVILLLCLSTIVAYEHRKANKGQLEELPDLADGDTSELEEALKKSVIAKVKKGSEERKKVPQKKNNADDTNPILDELQDAALSRFEEIREDIRHALGINPETGEPLKDDEYEDYDEPARPAKQSNKSDQNKKPKGKKPNNKEDDDSTQDQWEICDVERDEACTCEMEELHCDKVLFKDLLALDTPNLFTVDKKFRILIATFKGNAITKLEKGKIMSEQEKQINELDFTDNEIKSIEAGTFAPLTNLTVLKLTNNKLVALKKEWFKGAGHLHQLFLENNLLREVEAGVFKELKNLTRLVLDGNKLKLNKDSFLGLDNLESLSLDNCNLDEIDVNMFDNLPKLKKLSLRGNKFDEVPRAVNALTDLEELDISETNIAEFHAQSLKDDHNVQRLIMQNMPFLYAIQDCAFCGLQKLKALELDKNSKLYELHPNAFGFIKADNKVTSVKELYLEGGNLSTISEQLLDWDNIEKFTLGGNPINCSCQTAFLLGGELFKFEGSNNIPKCTFPESLKGRPIAKLNQWEACSSINKKERFGRAAVFLSLLLLLACVGLLTYLMYSTGRLDNLIGRARNHVNQFPSMSYANLSHNEEGRSLEADFEPRPEEV